MLSHGKAQSFKFVSLSVSLCNSLGKAQSLNLCVYCKVAYSLDPTVTGSTSSVVIVEIRRSACHNGGLLFQAACM
jgi:hypothetical protein